MALTTSQKEQQLRDVGWTPSPGDSVQAAWERTATPADQAAANASDAPAPAANAPKTASQDLSGYVAAMQASSGLSIKQLEEQKREFDANLEWQKQQWREQGLPELAIKQRAQDLEEAKFKELTDQAHFTQNLQTRQQDLTEKVQLGQLSVAQAQQQLAQEIQTGQLRVQQGQLGLDTLKTAASLSGPENWIQASNFNRGVAANAMLPGFVSDLLSGRSTATMAGVAPGAQMSAPQTLQGIAAQQGAAPVAAAVPAVAPAPQVTTQVQPQVAAPQQAGYWSVGQDGSMYFTPSGGVAASTTPEGQGYAPGTTSSMDPQHMAQFYYHATNAAGASPAATPGDVAQAFNRPPQTTQQNQTDAAAAGLQQVFAQGGRAPGPQQLEGLSDTEMKMFTGGGAALGADVPGYVRAYQNSRIGQTAIKPQLAMA
jgi:hypothetical protein